jgi:hypothetical protein
MESYPRGFHVYFGKFNIEESDSIYRIAKYIAFGLFHNSQIQKIDSNQQTLTFRYKSNVESITKEKSHQSLTMPIDEFLARMLSFLPNKHTSTGSVRVKNQFAIMEFTFDRQRRSNLNLWIRNFPGQKPSNLRLMLKIHSPVRFVKTEWIRRSSIPSKHPAKRKS